MTPDGPGRYGLDLPYAVMAYGATIPAMAGLEELLSDAAELQGELEAELSR